MQSSPWAKFRSRVGFEHFAVTLKDGDAIVGGAVVGKWTYDEGPLLLLHPGRPRASCG